MSDKTKTSDLPFFTRMGAYAASACFADFVTFPLDVAKVRLQVQGEIVRGPAGGQVMYRSLFGTITTIAGNEGFKSLYNGLSAGLQRQLCFSSIRLGMYEPVKKFYSQLFYGNTAGEGLNIPLRVAAGLTSGSLSVCLAQPTDVVKIRFQAMTRGNEARRYSSTRDAYLKIYKQEGYNGLWKGTVANATRNAIVNVAEIVVYDTVKDLLIMKGFMNDNIYCHFTTASIAGLTATFVASPVDVIKTRYMNSASGTYKSTLHCAVTTYKKEGFSAFYKGFVPSFYRIATWNIVLWVTFEQAKKLILERQRYRD